MPDQPLSTLAPAPRTAHFWAAAIGALTIYGLALYTGWGSLQRGFEMPEVAASLANVALNVTLFGALLLGLLYFVSRQTVASLTLQPGTAVGDLVDGLGLAGALLAAQIAFTVLFTGPDQIPAANQQIAAALAGDPWLLLVWAGPVTWLQAALLEEFTRTFILSRLWQVWNTAGARLAAVAAAAVLFGLGHMYQGWSGVGATALIGFILGYYYLRRGRVLPLIVAHGVNNMVVLAFLVNAARAGEL